MAIYLLEVKVVAPEGMKVGIIASRFNSFIVQKLLDAIVDYMPAPTDVPAIKGVNPTTEQEEERKSSDDAPFAALA